METIKLSEAKRWSGRGKPHWYRLAETAFGSLCGPDGRAVEEGEMEAGLIVRLGGISSDTNPWTGDLRHNRPSGKCVRDVTGAAWIVRDAMLVPATQEEADAQLAEVKEERRKRTEDHDRKMAATRERNRTHGPGY